MLFPKCTVRAGRQPLSRVAAGHSGRGAGSGGRGCVTRRRKSTPGPGTCWAKTRSCDDACSGKGRNPGRAVRSEAQGEGLECRFKEGHTFLDGGPQLYIPEILLIARWIDCCFRE